MSLLGRTGLACCVVLALGCGEEITEVVVTADSDLAVPREIDTVRFEVDATAIGGQTATRRIALNEGGQVLPVRLVIVHDGGPLGPVDVTAVGMRRGDDVVSRTARFYFVADRSLVLHLNLLSRCVDERCPEGMTCGEDGCRNVMVDPDPTGNDDAGATTADSGAPRTDAGPPETDAGPPDAGPVCEGTCMCAATCTTDRTRCECTDGCECSYECPAGGDCEQVKCDGEGTVCTVVGLDASDFIDAKCDNGADCTYDLRGVSNVQIKCDHGSTCEVDCIGASNCSVDCRNDSQCIVHCDPTTTNCEIKECNEEDLQVCGNLYACRVAACG